MFESATLRLTGWYLLILMTLSVLFSIVIYQVTSNELQTRLERFETSLHEDYDMNPPVGIGQLLRLNEEEQANANISIGLLYVNLFILIAGGAGSYFLARRNLLPIEKAHEAQSRFTSDASHELRTPLAVMKMEMEVALRDKNASVGDLKEVLSSNLEEVDKLTKLSEMLLNLSRLEHNKLDVEAIDLYKNTKMVLRDFKQPTSRIDIVKGKRLVVRGNDTAITELIKVLVENALLYSPKDSKVSIRLFKRGRHHAVFEITNPGPGILPKKLPHIFERFFRADSSRTNGSKKGYGLGLALAKRIVELHDGELIASSTPGETTTFSFILPTKNDLQAKLQD
jgi:signal transduction histidine kinase